MNQRNTISQRLTDESFILETKQDEPSSKLKQLFQNVQEIEQKVAQDQSLKVLICQSPYLPLGFNKNGVKVDLSDYSSLIAFTLNSNMYIKGLSLLDYMDLSSKLVPMSAKAANETIDRLSVADISFENKLVFDQHCDVLNENVPFSELEQELLRDTQLHFQFAFSTKVNPEWQIIRIEDQVSQVFESQNEFYSQDFKEMGYYLENPVNELLFQDLSRIIENIRKKQVKKIQRETGSANALDKKKTQAQNEEQEKEQNATRFLAYQDIYHQNYEYLEFSVKVYFPGQFEALRKIYCGNYQDFIISMFQSFFWKDNTGGKTKSKFYFSNDKKYVFKVVRANDIKMFEEMADSYFQYMASSFAQQCPTAIAKTLGIYKIRIQRGQQKSDASVYLMLMENLMLNVDDEVVVKYDLKGSRRNRFISNKAKGQVTLDNNFLYDFKSRPLPLQYSMQRILSIAIFNDSMYLSKNTVIDYSLFVVINPKTRKIRIGIIDYVQQYTLDKQLESFMKETISKEEPTIINPEDYKKRFRIAMDKYFIALIPDKDEDLRSTVISKYGQIKWFTKQSN